MSNQETVAEAVSRVVKRSTTDSYFLHLATTSFDPPNTLRTYHAEAGSVWGKKKGLYS